MSIMMAQMGLAGLGAVTDYMAASDEAKIQRRMQQYRNTLNRLSAERQISAINTNEDRARSSYAQNESVIQRTSIADKGRATVAAAAAGVKGNSVDMQLRDLQGSADKASFFARRQFHQQMADSGEQKKSVAIGAVANQDLQVLPKPSVGAMLLGAGTNLLSVYQSHQPELQQRG